MTYPEEVEETIGLSIEVEPLAKTPLEDLGLNASNHDILLSSREVLIFDEPEPQQNTLPSCLSLDVSLEDKRGPKPPIKPHSPDSFRMKVVDNLTIHTPPSPHVEYFHPMDMNGYLTKGRKTNQKETKQDTGWKSVWRRSQIKVNLPHSLANQLSQNFSISKLRESLVVSAYTNEVNHGRVYGVWMIGEEGGVMTSFKKLFNIKTPDVSPVSKVLGFTMSGEPIIETETDDKEVATVEVYKPCSEHIKDLRINGEDGSFFIFPYTETLLLVDHSDCCIISNDS
ncbi:hypothetical protein Tco_0779933 [Tanacetum coccineum]